MLRQFLRYTGYTTIVTAAYTMVKELQRKDDMRYDPSLKEASNEAIKDSSSCYGISRTLAVKAFRDMGWDKPIYISDLGHHIGSCSTVALDQFDRRAAFVYVPLGGNLEIHYATMAHEAVHCMHEHSAIKSAVRGYTWSLAAISAQIAFKSMQKRKNVVALMLTASAAFLASSIPMTIVGRWCERDADQTSATKLGTAHVLAYDLKQRNKEMRDRLDKQRQSLSWDNPAGIYKYARRCVKLFFDVHPSAETRIEYLQPLKNTALYKLPESQEYKDIVTKLGNKV
jgi:hypothetical protein